MRVCILTVHDHAAELAALTGWLAEQQLVAEPLTHVPVDYPLTTVRAIEHRMAEFDLVLVRDLRTSGMLMRELRRVLTAAEAAGTRFAGPLGDAGSSLLDTAAPDYPTFRAVLDSMIRSDSEHRSLVARTAREARAARP